MDNRVKQLLNAGHRVVDLGCGSGEMLRDLGGCFKERIGLDASRGRISRRGEEMPDGWKFVEADLNRSFDLESNSVDAIIANQVIEHIVDPIAFTKEIYRVLKSDGRCVITTPNIRYIRHIVHLVCSGDGPRTAGGNIRDGLWDDGHIHYFTHNDLRELFRSVGFRDVRSRALVDMSGGGVIRHWFDRVSESYFVRELLTGNILLWAIK